MGKVAKALSMESRSRRKFCASANSAAVAQRAKSEICARRWCAGIECHSDPCLSFALVSPLRGGKPNGLSDGLYCAPRPARGNLGARARRRHASITAEKYSLAALLQDVGLLALDRRCP